MSILFGIFQAENHAVEKQQLIDLSQATNRYAPDGTFVCSSCRIGMGFQPYHTNLRSKLESQPVVDGHGNMLAIDGRIDNHQELCALLDIRPEETADSRIVLTAFECWGDDCFSRFVGDWALALWSQADKTLYLARDHAGTRTLYFELKNGQILWSTHIETFLVDKCIRELDAGYAASYLSCRPIRDLTPYVGIRAVTPAHYFVFHDDNLARKPHWQWMVTDNLRYQTDAEYEEHFFTVFKQAVDRRTGPGAPILAHLSGGMDSTSIVCMSDHIRRARGASPDDLLDTLSYFDDSEPNWDEKPYFTAVENQRGKSGFHVSTSIIQRAFKIIDPLLGQYAFPGGDLSTVMREAALQELSRGKGYRTILSGIGGDELLGGVPNAIPELADYLSSGRIATLLPKAMDWSLADRTPLIRTLSDVIATTLKLYLCARDGGPAMPPWLSHRLRFANGMPPDGKSMKPLTSMPKRVGLRPSALVNGQTWWLLLESLPGRQPALCERFEYRFPLLDRDLVDYLFRIPREQIIRPGHRKSLLRRSVASIVPQSVLQRARKAYIARSPLLLLERSLPDIRGLMDKSMLSSCGFLDTESFRAHLDSAIRTADLTYWFPIMRTLWMEVWWQSMGAHGPRMSSIP